MFKAIGVLVALYAVYGAAAGEIFAKRGASGGMVKRSESPFNYWATISVYIGLSLALFFVF